MSRTYLLHLANHLYALIVLAVHFTSQELEDPDLSVGKAHGHKLQFVLRESDACRYRFGLKGKHEPNARLHFAYMTTFLNS